VSIACLDGATLRPSGLYLNREKQQYASSDKPFFIYLFIFFSFERRAIWIDELCMSHGKKNERKPLPTMELSIICWRKQGEREAETKKIHCNWLIFRERRAVSMSIDNAQA
jgi:hypothetical protein